MQIYRTQRQVFQAALIDGSETVRPIDFNIRPGKIRASTGRY